MSIADNQSEHQIDLSIIIVNHRTGNILPDCLESIKRSHIPFAFEAIIIDNPPENDDHDVLSDIDLEVRRFPTPVRIGFARASNLGASHAKGRYLLFLNPDIIVGTDAIRLLHDALQTDFQIGIATGRLVNQDGSFQPSCRRFPTLKNSLFSRGSIMRRLFRKQSFLYSYPDFPRSAKVEAAAAALMMIPRELFREVGGFDERYYMYMEDTDLCYRLVGLRKSVWYFPQAEAKHLWGYSTRHYRFRRIIWHHVSVWRFFWKHHKSMTTALILFPVINLNCLLSLLFEFFTLRG